MQVDAFRETWGTLSRAKGVYSKSHSLHRQVVQNNHNTVSKNACRVEQCNAVGLGDEKLAPASLPMKREAKREIPEDMCFRW